MCICVSVCVCVSMHKLTHRYKTNQPQPNFVIFLLYRFKKFTWSGIRNSYCSWIKSFYNKPMSFIKVIIDLHTFVFWGSGISHKYFFQCGLSSVGFKDNLATTLSFPHCSFNIQTQSAFLSFTQPVCICVCVCVCVCVCWDKKTFSQFPLLYIAF